MMNDIATGCETKLIYGSHLVSISAMKANSNQKEQNTQTPYKRFAMQIQLSLAFFAMNLEVTIVFPLSITPKK